MLYFHLLTQKRQRHIGLTVRTPELKTTKHSNIYRLSIVPEKAFIRFERIDSGKKCKLIGQIMDP